MIDNVHFVELAKNIDYVENQVGRIPFDMI